MVFPAVVSGFPVDSKALAFHFLFLLPYPRDPQSLPACFPSSRGVSVSSLWSHSTSRTGSLCPSLVLFSPLALGRVALEERTCSHFQEKDNEFRKGSQMRQSPVVVPVVD